jgi:hypothetical protein
MGGRQWVRVRSLVGTKPPEPEKAAITAAGERFLADVLRPRLPRSGRPRFLIQPPFCVALPMALVAEDRWHRAGACYAIWL